MHQCGRLERLAGSFLGHFGGGQLPQLLVDQWQEFFRGPGIPGLHRVQDAGDVAHSAAPVLGQGPTYDDAKSPFPD